MMILTRSLTRRLAPAVASAIVGAAGLPVSDASAASPYTSFTDVASTASGFTGINGRPSINNAGTAAFTGVVTGTGSGVFSGNGGPITTVAGNTGAPYASFTTIVDINDAGTVAFNAELDGGGRRIVNVTAGVPVTVADSSPTFNGFDVPAINAAGATAYEALSPASGMYTGNGVVTTTIASSFSDIGRPAINAAGTVAFWAGASLYTGNGVGGPTIFANTSGPLSNLGTNVSINDSGTVAFAGTLDGGEFGVFTKTGGVAGGPVTTIATNAGPFLNFGGDGPAINAAGDVVFQANLDAGGTGLFTGPDPINDRVIATGDLLFGLPVTGLTFYNGLNDGGDVAFGYTLQGGRTGVAVAAVPEPTGLALLGLGGAVLLGRRGRRAPTSK